MSRAGSRSQTMSILSSVARTRMRLARGDSKVKRRGGRRTGDGSNIAAAVLAPAAAEGHVVNLSMVSAKPATEGKDLLVF